MKLSHGIGVFSGLIGTVGLLVFAGCSSSSANNSGDGGSGSSSGGGGNDNCASLPATACTPAPSAPSGAKATSVTASHNYALRKLYLGDTDRSGNPSGTAWKSFGYNLDKKITTSSSTDVCTLSAGSMKSEQADGNGGIDNSFGENILPIIQSLDATLSSTLNTDLNEGKFTIMTYVTGFDDSSGNMTTATGLSGSLLAGASLATAPTWDLTTVWPVLPGLINGCTSTGGCPKGTDPIKGAQVQFPSAFQTNGTFVNGTASTILLTLAVGGYDLTLNISAATITFQPAAPGSVTNGTIAGVLQTSELLSALGSVTGALGVCPGSSTFTSVASQIQEASDIVVDSQGNVSNNAGTPCNGISIGLGFDSTEIAAPSAIAPGAEAGASQCDGG